MSQLHTPTTPTTPNVPEPTIPLTAAALSEGIPKFGSSMNPGALEDCNFVVDETQKRFGLSEEQVVSSVLPKLS